MDNDKKVFLYLVVIGGRIPKANIELHDVRWVVGQKIEDTFDELKNSWFGSLDGLTLSPYLIYGFLNLGINSISSQNF